MVTTTLVDGKRRQFIHRIYGLILLTLLGAGMLWALAALSHGASAQAGAKGGTPPASGLSYSPDCGHDWAIVTSPNGGTAINSLTGVAAVSTNDVWAVGFYTISGGATRTLAEHWDGSTWSVVPTPNATGTYSRLAGVTAISTGDVWAVGNSSNGTIHQTLIEHWNGTTWSIVSSPNQGTSDNYLNGVSSGEIPAASNDVWAVGQYKNGTVFRTLTEHWNGSTWTIVSSPNQGTGDNVLYSVSPDYPSPSPGSLVYAVGYYMSNGLRQSLAECWGCYGMNQWQLDNANYSDTEDNGLYAMVGTGSGYEWGVGWHGIGNAARTLLYFNDVVLDKNKQTEARPGADHVRPAWSAQDSPNPGSGSNILNAVAAVQEDIPNFDLWAVGGYASPNVSRTLIVHFYGYPYGSNTGWTYQYSPNANVNSNNLFGVAAVSGNDAWAVGSYDTTTGASQTLIEHYSTCSGTPTPVPTACPIQYTDVAAGSTFYDYVRCLACRQIVGGYNNSPPCTTGTPCFLPGNNITRGQMAKFISRAANYQDVIPPNQQTFTDVPPSHTFWQAIERVYLHGIVSGYTDPARCPTGIPCYLPGNSVTRGQTAKFISIAANYQDPIPSNQQTFTDVPPSHTFWQAIERVYLHGIVSGYQNSPPCTTGTPCFQPANNVTRGQAAKFVSKAFFPDCDTP